MKVFLIGALLVCSPIFIKAQTHFKIDATYANRTLVLDSLYDNTYAINKLRFYLSDIVLIDTNDRIIYTHPKKHILVDLKHPTSQEVHFYNSLSDSTANLRLQFGIGIDSTTNSKGAMADDLDPVNGMYWTWQSGYINVKIEGTKQREEKSEEFQFHLGGFTAPYNTYRTITRPYGSLITIKMDQFFKQMTWERMFIMRPGEEAVDLINQFCTSIHSSL